MGWLRSPAIAGSRAPRGIRRPGTRQRRTSRLHGRPLHVVPAPLPPARGLVERAADPFGLARAVWDRVDPAKRRGRRVWRGHGRVHLGVPGVVSEAGEELARAVEKALAAHPAVDWASVNAALGVVVVALADGEGPEDADAAPDEVVDDLIDLVEILEEREDADDRGASATPPAGTRPTRGGAGGHRAGRRRRRARASPGSGGCCARAPLPVELASLASFVDHQPRLRAAVERAHGPPARRRPARADQRRRPGPRPGHQRAARRRRLPRHAGRRGPLARRRLGAAPSRACSPAPSTPSPSPTTGCSSSAPVPLPLGPVERHGDQVGVAALAGFAGTLGISGSPRRAAGVALATLPKSGRMGREGFATTFGRVLSKRGAVVVEPTALRRMDRIDTVVLDAEALTTGVLMLGDLVAVPDAGRGHRRAWPTSCPGSTSCSTRARPPSRAASPTTAPTGCWTSSTTSPNRRRGGRPGLRRAGPRRPARPTAPPTSSACCATTGSSRSSACCPSRRSAAEALAAAARRAGLSLVLGTPDGSGPGVADRAVAAGDGLLDSVRALQSAGAGVLVVSRDRRALAAADLGIGVSRPDGTAPWGAHVLVGDDLGTAALLIEGVKVARGVSSRSVNLARAGTVLGAAMATAGTAPRGSSLAGLTVNGAAAVSLGAGAWSATELGRRVVVPGVSRTPWHVMPTATVLARLDTAERGLDRRRGAPPAARRPRRRGDPDQPRPGVPRRAQQPADPGAGGRRGALRGDRRRRRRRHRRRRDRRSRRCIGGVQRVVTDRAVAGLLERSSTRARVLRDGAATGLGADEVVVGDVIELGPDDVVPGRLPGAALGRPRGRRVLADRRVAAGRSKSPPAGHRPHRRRPHARCSTRAPPWPPGAAARSWWRPARAPRSGAPPRRPAANAPVAGRRRAPRRA